MGEFYSTTSIALVTAENTYQVTAYWTAGSCIHHMSFGLWNSLLYRVPDYQITGNLSTRRSWYHGRQPEVFLQHDSNCARQDVLELRSRTSKREFSGWNQRFKFWVLRRVFVIQKQKFFVWNHFFFVRMKQNLKQIFERCFQLNDSVGVRDGFT